MSDRSVRHPVLVRLYPATARAMECGGIAEHRESCSADSQATYMVWTSQR
ncbi:hypothetical protein [Prauserella flavalba]